MSYEKGCLWCEVLAHHAYHDSGEPTGKEVSAGDPPKQAS